jgi:hypothetical protein
MKAEHYSLVILSILVEVDFREIGRLLVRLSPIGQSSFGRAVGFARRPSRKVRGLFLIIFFALIHGFQNCFSGPI